MGRHHTGRQQLKHGESTEATLERHHQHQQNTDPGEPSGKPLSPCHGDDGHHQQCDADDEGVKTMKPLQENLDVHLPAWQERSVAERPVRTGETSLHHACRTTDDNECNNGDHKMCCYTAETSTNRSRGSSRHRIIP